MPRIITEKEKAAKKATRAESNRRRAILKEKLGDDYKSFVIPQSEKDLKMGFYLPDKNFIKKAFRGDDEWTPDMTWYVHQPWENMLTGIMFVKNYRKAALKVTRVRRNNLPFLERVLNILKILHDNNVPVLRRLEKKGIAQERPKWPGIRVTTWQGMNADIPNQGVRTIHLPDKSTAILSLSRQQRDRKAFYAPNQELWVRPQLGASQTFLTEGEYDLRDRRLR